MEANAFVWWWWWVSGDMEERGVEYDLIPV